MNKPLKHNRKTGVLARQLVPGDVYNWIVTVGYFPESYVLPPCFYVSKHPRFGKRYTRLRDNKFMPPLSQLCEVHFPKTELTDQAFGIIDPKIHSDIATEIASGWGTILDLIFDQRKSVYSYSFPIPLSTTTPGMIGALRAGRMIYEWIEMAENDLVEEAYRYNYLVKTDVKNFYPSIYTHSIAWALHTKSIIRSKNNRYDFSFLGNRIDKLFQNANDGCTVGIPIGPVVSDIIAEILLSAADLSISKRLSRMKVLGVRFKDDYRFLCKTEEHCRTVTKLLQKGLKGFNLLLNEEKTEIVELPEGIFRKWVSRYNAIRLKRGARLTFKEFKELYLGVLRIDREIPGTGVIDRFIADVTNKSYSPNFSVSPIHANKIISLLLLLAQRRIRSFPRILGLIEAMMETVGRTRVVETVEQHLNKLLEDLAKDPEDNHYQISWILYFLRSNNLKTNVTASIADPILMSIQSNRGRVFTDAGDFRLFRGVREARRYGSLLKHTDVFRPQ